jgi:S-ribosylhomocysteine lyase LuxS involved in autoinducer biosynthesis
MYISIVGGVVVVTGLYLVVWGKSKEQKRIMLEEEAPQKISQQGQQQLPITVPKIDVNDNNKHQLVIIGDQTST